MNKAIIAGVIVLGSLGFWYVYQQTPDGQEPEDVQPLTCADIISEIEVQVSAVFDGDVATVLFDEARLPGVSSFRTAIMRGAAEGVDFAGHYAVASWGCGTQCQQHAIIDVVTGRIVAFNIQSALGVSHSATSTLFITNPPENTQSTTVPEDASALTTLERSYYNLRNGRLSLICSEPLAAGRGRF